MYCNLCGKVMHPSERFCSTCGTESTTQQPGMNAPPVPHQQNTMAILGLVFAFIMPLLGIIFSAIGLSRANQMNGEGRGMAIAGLVLSIAYIVFATIIAIVSISLVTEVVRTWPPNFA